MTTNKMTPGDTVRITAGTFRNARGILIKLARWPLWSASPPPGS
jgi:hypothetical protein